LLFATLPAAVHAQFLFVTNNGTIIITGYTGAGGAVTIPSEINGWPVTTIAEWAFEYCTTVTDVTIPSSITNIEQWAFGDCLGLTIVTIGNSVAYIGDYAFFDCPSLTTVTIPSSVATIGSQVFSACSSLTAITVDALNPSYSSVDGILFDKSQSTLIRYPEAKAGSSYTLPGSVTAIEDSAFEYCANLTTISIPDSVNTIGDSAFGGCPSLSTITVGDLNPSYCSFDGVLFNKSQSTLIQCPGAKSGSYTVPDTVTNIGYDAFEFCTYLTNVTILNRVTDIGDWAFAFCDNLTGVYFHGNAPTLGGSDAFFDDNRTTIYYLPGTTGWGSTFGGRPTGLWNPQAQNLGVQANHFRFDITGTTNIPIVVDTCTNLANPAWVVLQSCTLTNGSLYFSDPEQWTNHPARFYRLRWP